jgi:hypothetical protein
LKLRLKILTPAAYRAEPTVSPSKAVNSLPSKVKRSCLDRLIRCAG